MNPLPCPCCGGTATINRDGGSYGYYPPSAWVNCSKCHLTAAKFWENSVFTKGKWQATNDPTADAIAAWNRRVA